MTPTGALWEPAALCCSSKLFDKIISLPSSLKSHKRMEYMLLLKHESHLDIAF